MEYTFRSLTSSDILDEARQKDKPYIANFARINSDGTVLRNFSIIPHENSDENGRYYRIVYNDDNILSSKGKGPEEAKACTIDQQIRDFVSNSQSTLKLKGSEKSALRGKRTASAGSLKQASEGDGSPRKRSSTVTILYFIIIFINFLTKTDII